MTFRPLFLLPLLLSPLTAESLKVSPALFNTPEFRARFVGSYGFLPEVEPKVDQEEARFIADLADILGKGRFAEAEKKLLTFIKQRKNPTDPEVEAKGVSAALVFTLGNLYYQNGRVPEAESAYKTAIKRFPEYRRAHKNLALLFARTERMDDAKPHLLKAIDLGDTDDLSYGILGNIHLNAEKFIAAESAFRQAYLLAPENKDWKIGLVQSLLGKEDWAQSASMMQTLIDESPDDATMWMQQANCYIQTGEFMRAAENYEVLRLKGLADETSLNQLGDIYANQEQPLLALGAYLSAMEKSEQVDIDRSLKSAKYLLQLNAPLEAESIMKTLRSTAGAKLSKDDQIDAYLFESDIAVAKQQLDEASNLIEKALQISQANGAARIKLGNILLERSALSEDSDEADSLRIDAIVSFKHALSDSDDKVLYDANLALAQTYVKAQEYQKAVPFLEQALRVKTGSKEALTQYSRRVQRAAEKEKARKEREALEAKIRKEEDAKAETAAAEDKKKAESEAQKTPAE